MVEILLVLAISLIVVGLGNAAVSAMTGKRGLNGAASIISSQVNLARSTAVSQNRYVALLTPEPFAVNVTSSNELDFKPFFCNQMRLCFVTPASGNFEFAGWIEGHDWLQLPARTCAHPIQNQDYATLSSPRPIYSVDRINAIPVFDGGSNLSSTGIVFAPTGRLANYGDVMIQAYNALPNANNAGKPNMSDLGIKPADDIQGTGTTKLTGTQLPYRRWCISINKFTGRTKVTYAQPEGK
jgi:hypothetical protein